MKENRILTLATLAAAVAPTPNLIADDGAASRSASASTCTAGEDVVAVAAGAENGQDLVAAVKAVAMGPFPFHLQTGRANHHWRCGRAQP